MKVERSVKLDRLDAALELEAGTLAALNPALRRQATPKRAYDLRVPAGREETLLAQLGSVPEWTPPVPQYATHRVRSGETLSQIAGRYRTSVSAIMRANGLRSANRLRVGQRLRIPVRGAAVAAAGDRDRTHVSLTSRTPGIAEVLSDADPGPVRTRGRGPGRPPPPRRRRCCATAPSGDLFGLTQNAGMGWDPAEATRTPYLVLSTLGGLRGEDGRPDRPRLPHRPLGGGPPGARGGRDDPRGRRASLRGLLHGPLRRPHAGHAGDDGQPAVPQRRGDRHAPPDPLAPTARGRPRRRDLRQGAARDDARPRGLPRPAGRDRPRRRHAARRRTARTAGAVQTLGARFAHGLVTLDEAADLACRACGSPGGGCQFLGTAATAQVVAEALGLVAPPQRARSLGRAGVARHGPPLGPRAAAARRAAASRSRAC